MTEFPKTPDEITPVSEKEKQAGEISPQPVAGDVSQSSIPKEPSTEPEGKPIITLAMPSKELAARLLSEVGFQEHLTGTRMSPSLGNIQELIYSLKGAANLLHVKLDSDWMSRQGSIGYIELKELGRWIRETLGDVELADAIDRELGEDYDPKDYNSLLRQFGKHQSAIKELILQRLAQCQEVVGEVV